MFLCLSTENSAEASRQTDSTVKDFLNVPLFYFEYLIYSFINKEFKLFESSSSFGSAGADWKVEVVWGHADMIQNSRLKS